MRLLINPREAEAGGIYAITNTVNDLIYVGAAVHLRSRFLWHDAALRSGKHENERVQKVADNVGYSSMCFELLELWGLDSGSWRAMEQKWLDYFIPEKLLNKDLTSHLSESHPTQAKALTRVKRGVVFTFDEEGDKEKYHAHAKRRGTNLANLIKMLLASDLKASDGPAAAPVAGR